MNNELSMQDEEFLEDINTLSEEKKNSIIAYMQNKLDALKQQLKAEQEKEIAELKQNYVYKDTAEYDKNIAVCKKDLDKSLIIKQLQSQLKAEQEKNEQNEYFATKIHYPKCWDDVAYPTLASALWEMLILSEYNKCSVCNKIQQSRSENK